MERRDQADVERAALRGEWSSATADRKREISVRLHEINVAAGRAPMSAISSNPWTRSSSPAPRPYRVARRDGRALALGRDA